jgi:hypothetical protein
VFCVFHLKLMTMAAGGRRGNRAQSLAQWRHPVASSEARDVLHQAMRPALHRCIPMTIKMAGDLHVFFCNRQFYVFPNHS